MPFLHCIATKCTIPPSEKYPSFWSSSLPRDGATLSHRALPGHISQLAKRFYSANPNTSRAAIIACVVLTILGLIASVWRFILLRRQREELSSQAKFNTDAMYWAPPTTSIPPPAYGYEMNRGKPVGVGPYAAPAEVHYKAQKEPHWNDVNQLVPKGRSRGSKFGVPRGSRQLYHLPRRQDGRSHSQDRLMASEV
jgi:hypothetical protein